MSLPLTRRIARAALLLAAGAAPVVGAAGAASAAGLESVPQLGALTAPDATVAAAGDTATEAVPVASTLPAPAPADEVTGAAGSLLAGLPLAGGGLPGGLPGLG